MSTSLRNNFQPGQQVSDRYRLVKQLPTPAHLLHWLAEDLYRPKHPSCLVKIALANSEAGNCLQQEALILQPLQHPQVPSLLALDQQTSPYIYLVCDYIEGTLLGERLQSGQRWTEQQVHGFLQASLSILAVCHQQQVIHGDLQPDCWLQRSSDQSWMITGFGASQGTIGYIAPERGQGYPCVASDLYSLGMIAIQALTGQSPSELQQAAKTGEIRWQQYCQVERSLKSLLSRMVAFRPGDRPTSAQDALEQLTSPNAQTVGATTPVFPVKVLQTPAQAPASQQIPLLPTPIPTKPKPVATFQPAEMLTGLTSQFNRSPLWKGLAVGTGFASACAGLMCYLPGKPATTLMGQVASSSKGVLKELPTAADPSSRNASIPHNNSRNNAGLPPALVPAMPTQSQLARSQSASQPSSPRPTPKQQPQQSTPKETSLAATNAPTQQGSISTIDLEPMVREDQRDHLAQQAVTIAAATMDNSPQAPRFPMVMADRQAEIVETVVATTDTGNAADQAEPVYSSQAQAVSVTAPTEDYSDSDIGAQAAEQVATIQPLIEGTAEEESPVEVRPIAVDLPSPEQSMPLAVEPTQPLAMQTNSSEPMASPLQVILSPDDQWMISISDRHTIKVWNLTAGNDISMDFSTTQPIHRIILEADGVTLLSIATDGSLIASWDLSSGQQVY